MLGFAFRVAPKGRVRAPRKIFAIHAIDASDVIMIEYWQLKPNLGVSRLKIRGGGIPSSNFNENHLRSQDDKDGYIG